MAHSRDPLTYRDCEEKLDAAIATANGLILNFPSASLAVRFVQRANVFRTLLRKDNREVYGPDHDMFGRSVYDQLILRRNGAEVVIEKLDQDVIVTEL